MSSTVLIAILIAVPLGFLVGQMFFRRTGTPLGVVPEQPHQPAVPSAGEIARLRAERDDLRQHVMEVERTANDLRAEIDGTQQMETAEDVSLSVGAQLEQALAERDEAVGRLKIEKANHAETHRALEGAENHLKLLITHLDDPGAVTQRVEREVATQVADLRESVNRLAQQFNSSDLNRVPTEHR